MDVTARENEPMPVLGSGKALDFAGCSPGLFSWIRSHARSRVAGFICKQSQREAQRRKLFVDARKLRLFFPDDLADVPHRF
jgi:hypothetical protein